MAKMTRNLAANAAAAAAAQLDPEEMAALLSSDDIDPALERIFGEIGGDTLSRITVYIYKINDATGKEPRIWSGAPDDYDLTALAKRFGSGDYRIKIMGPNDEGKPVLKANQVVPMLLDPAEDQRIEAMRRGELTAPNAQSTVPALTAADIAKAVTEAIRASAPAPVDPFASLDKVAGIVQKLIPQQAGGGMGGIREVLEAGKMIAEMSRGNSDDGPRDGTKPRDFAMTRGIALIEKLFARHIEQQPIAGAAPVAHAAEHVSAGAPNVSQDDIQALEELRDNLRKLVSEAEKDTDAEKVAEFVYEDVPDNLIAEMATNPEWFKIICANVPECAKHSEWFFKLKDHLVAYAKEDGILTQDGHLRIVVDDGATAAGKPTA